MLTPTQRNFRKQMKDLEKEDKIPDSYRPRRKRPKLVRRISIISLIFLLWNSFAIYTWLAPIFGLNRSKVSRPNKNPLSAFSSSSKEKGRQGLLVTYLDRGKDVDLKISQIIEKINENTSGTVYEKDDISSDVGALDSLNNYIYTIEDEFKDLQYIYIEKISLTKKMLMNLFYDLPIDSSEENLVKKWSDNQQSQRDEIIRLFDIYNIDYQIKDDGRLSYSY